MPDKRPRRKGRPPRPQAAPPALMSAGEPFEGFNLLEEGKGIPTLVLWQTLRDVLLWASTPEERRRRLFVEGSEARRIEKLLHPGVDGVVRAPLVTLSGILLGESGVGTEEVAAACRRITRWAEERGLSETAISFAQAAAAVLPGSGADAYTVGLLCRKAAQYERAETWFRRAIRLAVKRDRATYALAHIGLGNLYRTRGKFELARALHLRALRAARRKGLKEIQAMALHDLFSIAVEKIEVSAAEHLARETFGAYPPDDPRLPALAHDVAFFWVLQGYFERALSVLQAIFPLIHDPAVRMLVLSNIARASGGAGKEMIFLDAWIEVWKIVSRSPHTDRACSALLNLAYGAASLGDWERVGLAARNAARFAAERHETGVQEEAEALLAVADDGQFDARRIAPPSDPEVIRAADSLADDFIRTLTACAGEI